MTSNDLDTRLAQFLTPLTREVEDNGFSERVVRGLPRVKRTPRLVHLGMLSGLICSLLLTDAQVIFGKFLIFWKDLLDLKMPGTEVILITLILFLIVFVIVHVETDQETAY